MMVRYNISNYSYNADHVASRTVSIKITSIIIAVMAIIGNAIVCHIILRIKTMKTSINYIILNLGILDATCSILAIFYVFSRDYYGFLGTPILSKAHSQSMLLAEILCRIQWCFWLSFAASPPLLMIMAYERYMAIVHPLSRLDGATAKSKLKWVLPIPWIIGIAYMITEMSVIQYNAYFGFCAYKEMPWWFSYRLYACIIVITHYIIPSTSMLTCYLRIVRTLRKPDDALGPQAEAKRARQRATKKVMWIAIVVTLTFYICCAPPHILSTLYAFGDKFSFDIDLVLDIGVLSMSFYAAFNPFIYFIFIQSFRSGFREVFMSIRS